LAFVLLLAVVWWRFDECDFFGGAFQSYVPENFEDPAKYYLFLVSAVPTLVLVCLQLAVSTILISVRTWDLLILLRWIIAAQVMAGCGAAIIDAFYFPDNVTLNFLCLAPDCLDTELSVFMQWLRVQGVGGEPELA